MDKLTFIVEMTKALAWPIAATVIAVTFRAQIRELIRRIKKGKLGPAEFEFEERLRELAEANPEVASSGTSPASIDGMRTVAEPRAIVFENWLGIEQEIRDLAAKAGITGSERMPVGSLVSSLESAGKIEPLASALFRDMRHLRNSAAHAFEFQPEP